MKAPSSASVDCCAAEYTPLDDHWQCQLAMLSLRRSTQAFILTTLDMLRYT
jgi:hypothetical protein